MQVLPPYGRLIRVKVSPRTACCCQKAEQMEDFDRNKKKELKKAADKETTESIKF